MLASRSSQNYHLIEPNPMSTGPLPSPWVLDINRDPPAYTRPLVGSELSMQKYWDAFDADGEVCIGANFSSSLRREELEDRARRAFDSLRFVCPIIACTVEDVTSPRWVYTPSADRQAWLDLALVVEERGTSLDPPEFIERIKFKRLPYTNGNGTSTFLRAYLLTTSKDDGDHSEEYGLYFHGSHTIIDAGPALHALNLMCEWISGEGMDVNIEPLEEWRNLPVDPITATGGPSKEWGTAGTKLLQEFAEQNARNTPCHTLAPPSRPLIMSDPQIYYTIDVPELETAAIVSQAKKLEISVSTLFHAAHCLAQVKMNPIPASTEVDFSSPTTVVSLERYLKPPVNPKTHFISSFVMVPWRFSMAHPFMQSNERDRLIITAKMLQERLNKHLANPCFPHVGVALGNTLSAESKPDDAKLAREAEAQQSPMWHCAFNNLGVVEQKLRTRHGNITIGSICIGNRLRNFMTVHMWTMGSKFHLQVQGATAWGEECIKMLLDETLRIGLLILDENQST